MAIDHDFDRFYLAARGRLVGQLFALTGDLHDAEDLVQEAFARAAAEWRRISVYEHLRRGSAGSPSTWPTTAGGA